MNQTAQNNSAQQERIGIVLRILSGIAFTVMGGLVKYVAEEIPLGQIVFFRSAFALIPLLMFLLWQREFPHGLRTANPRGHLLRCGIGVLAMFVTFATLRYLPVAEATMLTYLSPVILVILATLWLKETVSARRWWGVFLGVAGLLVMTAPNFSVHHDADTLLGIICGVLSAIFIAGGLLQVRQLSRQGEKSGTIAFYFAISSTVIGGLTLLFDWVMPTPVQWVCLIGMGLVGGIAQLLMTISFNYAEASALAPYEYLSVLWAVLMGVVFFSEVPNLFFYLAMPLIVVGALVARPARRR